MRRLLCLLLALMPALASLADSNANVAYVRGNDPHSNRAPKDAPPTKVRKRKLSATASAFAFLYSRPGPCSLATIPWLLIPIASSNCLVPATCF